MQVFGIKGLERKEPVRKTRKAASAGVFSVESGDDETQVQEGAPVSSMHSIQSILSLQTMHAEIGLEAASYKKGEKLLAEMDKLLDAKLIENQADKAQALSNLATAAAGEGERSVSAELENVIDEIKLRAAVELAKSRSRS